MSLFTGRSDKAVYGNGVTKWVVVIQPENRLRRKIQFQLNSHSHQHFYTTDWNICDNQNRFKSELLHNSVDIYKLNVQGLHFLEHHARGWSRVSSARHRWRGSLLSKCKLLLCLRFILYSSELIVNWNKMTVSLMLCLMFSFANEAAGRI